MGLRPLACWGCGFESRRGLGCLFWASCVVRQRSLRRADHLSRGVLPSMVCLSVTVKPRQWEDPGALGVVAPWGKKSFIATKCNYAEKRRIVLSYVVKFIPWIWFNGSSEYITYLFHCFSICLWRNLQYMFSCPEDHLGWRARKSWMAGRLSVATGEAGGSLTVRNIHGHSATKCEFNATDQSRTKGGSR